MPTKLPRIVPAVAVAVAALLALLVYLRDEPESTLERVAREGVIRVGYVEGPPFSYRSPGGDVTGVSPAVARVVLRELGAPRLEWVRTELGSVAEFEEARSALEGAGYTASAVNSDANSGFGTFTSADYTVVLVVATEASEVTATYIVTPA